ncbi:MAG TPA: hypothetical protein VGB85_32055 [Nannocystis sp.]|jgi:Tfp pilus assembly protein PilO
MSAGSILHGSPLQTLIVWVLGTCVAAVVWYAVFYRAAHDEWVAASNELGAARSDLEQARAARVRADGRARELDVAAAELSTERARVLPGAPEDLVFTVPALASAIGLEVVRWRPSELEVDGALLRAPVQVDARGRWPAALGLMTRVLTLPEVVALDRLAMRTAPDGALELQFTLSTVQLREAP